MGTRIQSLAVSWSQGGENSGGSCSSLPTISSERTDAPALSSLLSCDGLVPELLLRQAPAPRVLRNRPQHPAGHQHTHISLTRLHPPGGKSRWNRSLIGYKGLKQIIPKVNTGRGRCPLEMELEWANPGGFGSWGLQAALSIRQAPPLAGTSPGLTHLPQGQGHRPPATQRQPLCCQLPPSLTSFWAL